jgi:hypothetical protein
MTNIQKKGREFMKSLVQRRPAFLSEKKKWKPRPWFMQMPPFN